MKKIFLLISMTVYYMKIAREGLKSKILLNDPYKLQSKQIKPLKKPQSMEKADKSIGDRLILIANALSEMNL